MSSQHIKGIRCQHDLSLRRVSFADSVSLSHVTKAALARHCKCQSIPFSTFDGHYHSILWKQITEYNRCSKGRRRGLKPLEGHSKLFQMSLVRDVPIFHICLSVCLFLSVSSTPLKSCIVYFNKLRN